MTTQPIDPLVAALRQRALAGETASQLLRFLVIDQGIEQQLCLMELFSDAFGTNLGSLTAIGAWWHEGERELDDAALDSYIGYLIDAFRAHH